MGVPSLDLTLTMRCLLLLPALFALATPAPGGPIWWNVEDMMWNAEDWAYDLSYNLTHMNAGGPFGLGILGLVFPTTTTTTTTEAPTTTRCGGVLGLGLA